MGYTHYWNHRGVSADQWTELCADARRIIKAAGVPIAGANGAGRPVINESQIALNGVRPEDWCESFYVTPSATSFEFTKTGYRPYDVVVSTILLRAALTIPGFAINSDGTWDEWQPARDLYATVFGQAAPDEPVFLRES